MKKEEMTIEKIHTIEHLALGQVAYQAAWDLQRRLHTGIADGVLPDALLTLDHPHTYTLGKQSHVEHLLLTPEELSAQGINVFEIDRGGDITYHGPGQLVAYPILNMHRYYLDVHRYLRDLEEVVIRTLAEFGVGATRKTHPDPKKNYTGVWIGDEKICAIGVRFSRWTSMHGLALNLNTDLAYFSGIVPCGIRDKPVTSLASVVGETIDASLAERLLVKHFAAVFNASVVSAPLENLQGASEPSQTERVS